MSDDPFSGLSDTVQDRKRRDGLARKQDRKRKWVAFWAALGATVLVAIATGVGGAGGGWVIEQDSRNVFDRILGGVVCGLFGAACGFFGAVRWVTEKSVLAEVHGEQEDTNIGPALFWAMVGGAGLLGSIGAALGLMGRGMFRIEVLGCAVAAALLALIPAALLRRISIARLKRRIGSGPATYRKRD